MTFEENEQIASRRMKNRRLFYCCRKEAQRTQKDLAKGAAKKHKEHKRIC
jgi:hypothetical protein